MTKKVWFAVLIACFLLQVILFSDNTAKYFRIPAVSYDDFVRTCECDVSDATIGTNIKLHQTIHGVDTTKYRYKLKTDCPHWKYEDRYMSNEALPFTEKSAAVETEAKELKISYDREVLVTAQHFYVPLLNLYDEDITFEEFKEKQIDLAYDTLIENLSAKRKSLRISLIINVIGIIFLIICVTSIRKSNNKGE